MTFIASVIAKNGCAVIADSLVTTSSLTMGWSEFRKYIASKKGPDGNVVLDHNELTKLFVSRPSHTKNYEEKLFVYDGYSVVTTAGAASIHGKKIEELIEELKIRNVDDVEYQKLGLEARVEAFCAFFASNVAEHVKANGRFYGTSFIYTNYNRDTHKTTIYKIALFPCDQKAIEDPNFKQFSSVLQPENFKVVCDGQNRISEGILFGDIETVNDLLPKVVDQVVKDHNLKIDPSSYYESVFTALQNSGQLATLTEDMKMFQISSLSLQQAVDLACLLMKLETDFQQYTRNVPTVGGLTKLAKIDKDGAKLISGDEIIKPKYIR